MKKGEYLRKLGLGLKGLLPDEEVADIVRDYDEYFEEGFEEGKTEDKLINEFGSPESVVAELLTDAKTAAGNISAKGSKIKVDMRLIIRFASALLFCVDLAFLIISWHRPGTPLADCFGVLTLPVLLALSWFHTFKSRGDKSVRKHPYIRIILTVLFCVIIGLAAIGSALFLLNLNHFLQSVKTQSDFGQYLGYFLDLVYFMITVTVIWILYLASKNDWANGLLFYPAGALLTTKEIDSTFFSMGSDTLNRLTPIFYRSLVPFVFGMALAIIASLLILWRKPTKSEGM